MYYQYIYNYYHNLNSPLSSYLLNIIQYHDNITHNIINIIKNKPKLKNKKNLFHLIFLLYISIIFSFSLINKNLSTYLYQNFKIKTDYQFNLNERLTILIIGVLSTEILSIPYPKYLKSKLNHLYLKYHSNHLINLDNKNNYFKLFLIELFQFLQNL